MGPRSLASPLNKLTRNERFKLIESYRPQFVSRIGALVEGGGAVLIESYAMNAAYDFTGLVRPKFCLIDRIPGSWHFRQHGGDGTTQSLAIVVS